MRKTKGGTGGEGVAGRSNCRAYREGAIAFIVSKGGGVIAKEIEIKRGLSYISLFNFALT